MAEKVLIVDDDVQTVRLVSLMLERQGFRVVTASNGFQGLRVARLEQPSAILLDVMMPDMDGYEVTHFLRKNPETAHIPILMFTARSQMEDKVKGFEAGVDDYLTKPIHPAELVAHLRELLARHANQGGAASQPDRGYTIGVLAAKGGLGVSTVTLNLALMYSQKTRQEVIAAELRSGQGTWNTELALNQPDGLTNLLSKQPMEITQEVVEKELAHLPSGVRLLLSSARTKDIEYMSHTKQLESIVDILPLLSHLVLLDIGTTFVQGVNSILNCCDEVIVVTEPFPSTAHRTRFLVEDLIARGFGKSKVMSIISINLARADVQMSLLQTQEIIKMPITQVIPAVPEAAYQAATRNIPICQVEVNSMFAMQFLNMANVIAQRVAA